MCDFCVPSLDLPSLKSVIPTTTKRETNTFSPSALVEPAIPSTVLPNLGFSTKETEPNEFALLSTPPPITLPEPDFHPLESSVKRWLPIANPVIATCRACKHRGYVDNPVIGLL